MLKVWLFLIELLQWARTNVPQMFSVGVVVYDSLAKRIRDLESENAKLRLELKEIKNANEVANENKEKSDLDVVNDIVNSPSSLDGSGTKS